MKKILGHLFNFLGNICYDMNGGLDHVNDESRLDRLAMYFWAKAYGQFDRITSKRVANV